MQKPYMYLSVEVPDREAIVDFLGKYGVQVKMKLDLGGELHIQITACDDRCTILEDKVYDVPKADPCN